MCCTLRLEQAATVATEYDSFVGNSVRSVEKEVSMRCLYNRQLSEWAREKFGLTEDVSGTLYLSPILLFQEFGDWRIEGRKLLVTLIEETYRVQRVQYIGHIPKFNTCLAVEIRLTDSIRGGP